MGASVGGTLGATIGSTLGNSLSGFDLIRQEVEAFCKQSGLGQRQFALAFSGGADSTVLLHVCHSLAQQLGFKFHAVHVNHGLQKPADEWELQCRQIAQQLNLPFQALKVRVDRKSVV